MIYLFLYDFVRFFVNLLYVPAYLAFVLLFKFLEALDEDRTAMIVRGYIEIVISNQKENP